VITTNTTNTPIGSGSPRSPPKINLHPLDMGLAFLYDSCMDMNQIRNLLLAQQKHIGTISTRQFGIDEFYDVTRSALDLASQLLDIVQDGNPQDFENLDLDNFDNTGICQEILDIKS
jgi:hypothetical protein